jgi:SulP family sulfate permease
VVTAIAANKQLAGILFKVGYDIIDVSYLMRAHKGPRRDLALMTTVLGLAVFVDLITAVAVRVILAALAFVKKMADEALAKFGNVELKSLTPEERALLQRAGGKLELFVFDGTLSFGAAAELGPTVQKRLKGLRMRLCSISPAFCMLTCRRHVR